MSVDTSDIDWRAVLAGADFDSDDPEISAAETATLKLCGADALALYERRFKSWAEDLPSVLCGVMHMEYLYRFNAESKEWDAELVAGRGARECATLAEQKWDALSEIDKKKQPAFVRSVFGNGKIRRQLTQFAGAAACS